MKIHTLMKTDILMKNSRKLLKSKESSRNANKINKNCAYINTDFLKTLLTRFVADLVNAIIISNSPFVAYFE